MRKLIIVEDSLIVRTGLKFLLEEIPGIKVVSEIKISEMKLNLVKGVDLIIIGIDFADTLAIELAEKIKKRHKKKAKILILTAHENETHLKYAIEVGANAYLSMSCNKQELFQAIEKITQGHTYYSDVILKKMTKFINVEAENKPNQTLITPREMEILNHLAKGKNNQQIGKELGLSSKTIYNHTSNISRKLEAKNTTGMLVKAIQLQLINVNEL